MKYCITSNNQHILLILIEYVSLHTLEVIFNSSSSNSMNLIEIQNRKPGCYKELLWNLSKITKASIICEFDLKIDWLNINWNIHFVMHNCLWFCCKEKSIPLSCWPCKCMTLLTISTTWHDTGCPRTPCRSIWNCVTPMNSLVVISCTWMVGGSTKREWKIAGWPWRPSVSARTGDIACKVISWN